MDSIATWERLAPNWDAMLADPKAFMNREESFRRFHWFLKRTVRPGNRTKTCRLLDLGCGTGEAAWPLWKRVASVTFFDRSPIMLRLARNKYEKGIFVRGDAADLPFLDAEFDIVVSRGALISQLEPEAVPRLFQHVWRTLRTQGLFLFDFACQRQAETADDGSPGFIGAWTRPEMEALIRRVVPSAAIVAWDGIASHAFNRVLLKKT